MKTASQISAAIADLDKALVDLGLQAERAALRAISGTALSATITAQHEAEYQQCLAIIGDKQRQRQRLAYALAEAQRVEDGDI